MGAAVSGCDGGLAWRAAACAGTAGPWMLASNACGVSAQVFLLPLIVGISSRSVFVPTVVSPVADRGEMREDAASMAHLLAHAGRDCGA